MAGAGAAGGAFAGGLLGRLNTQNPVARVAVGGVAGAVVSGGMTALHLGRWDEAVIHAAVVGGISGAVDAAADYHFDRLAVQQPGRARSAGGDTDASNVQRAMDTLGDPNATRGQKSWAQNVLLDAGLEGPRQSVMVPDGAWARYADEPSVRRLNYEMPFRWDHRVKQWRATADFEFGNKKYRAGDFVAQGAVNARVYQAARQLGFTDRLIGGIEDYLKAGEGRHLLIELSDLSNLPGRSEGAVGLKPTTRFEGQYEYKGKDRQHIKSDAEGYVRNPETGEILAISDPDIMAVVEGGKVLSDARVEADRHTMNEFWEKHGPDVPGPEYYPYQHSHRATYYEQPNAASIAMEIPKHVADFYLNDQGQLRVKVISGQDRYLNYLERITCADDLSRFPWYRQARGEQ